MAPATSSQPTTPPPARKLSLKTRSLIWRARYSTPALLARFDERKVVAAVSATNGGLSILAIGLFACWTDLPLAFPALGPTAFILFSDPMSHSAAPRSIILGHLMGLMVGYGVWQVVSALAGAPVSAQAGGWPLFVSPCLALVITSALLVRIHCLHPPACASSLVIAFGGVTQWSNVLLMAVVVVWITAQAGVLNRLAGLPTPAWAPRPTLSDDVPA